MSTGEIKLKELNPLTQLAVSTLISTRAIPVRAISRRGEFLRSSRTMTRVLQRTRRSGSFTFARFNPSRRNFSIGGGEEKRELERVLISRIKIYYGKYIIIIFDIKKSTSLLFVVFSLRHTAGECKEKKR